MGTLCTESTRILVFPARTMGCRGISEGLILCSSALQELVVKLVAMDSDKWASPSTVGEVTQPLRDIKNLAALPERTTLNYFLAQPKLVIT